MSREVNRCLLRVTNADGSTIRVNYDRLKPATRLNPPEETDDGVDCTEKDLAAPPDHSSARGSEQAHRDNNNDTTTLDQSTTPEQTEPSETSSKRSLRGRPLKSNRKFCDFIQF